MDNLRGFEPIDFEAVHFGLTNAADERTLKAVLSNSLNIIIAALAIVPAAEQRAAAAEARVAKLTEALRMAPCPVAINGLLTVAECVDGKQCGCVYGAALSPAAAGREGHMKPGWQPLDTAPADTDVNVWFEPTKDFPRPDVVRARLVDGVWRDADGRAFPHKPQYWMPVPDPPEPATFDGGTP